MYHREVQISANLCTGAEGTRCTATEILRQGIPLAAELFTALELELILELVLVLELALRLETGSEAVNGFHGTRRLC